MYDERHFLKNEQHFFDEFEFKNGFVIENAKVDYGVVGTPKYDEDGNIINAILFCHNFHGNYSTISDFRFLADKNRVFDREEYFFISLSSLGFPESCSPSTSGLNHNFPNYEIEDLVNFQRQFIKERFPNIKKLKGIIGYSVGGVIALGWAAFYPDDMEFIIHFSSSFKSLGYKYIFANLANRIIDQSSEYLYDMYDESFSKVLISISQLHYLMSFSRNHLNVISNEEIDLSIENYAEDILFLDIYDMKFCNDFIMSFDLEPYLDKIKCKLLVVAVDDSNYYIPEFDAIPLHEAVEHSQYILLEVDDDSNLLQSLDKIEDDLKEFMDSL